LTDGTVYEVDHVEIQERFRKKSGIYLNDYSKLHIPFIIGRTALEIPFDKVERVTLAAWIDGSVTLIDGQQLEGRLGHFYRGSQNEPRSLTGLVAGRHTTFSIHSIESIAFVRDDTGELSATVTARDGTITQGISFSSFRFDGGTSLAGAYHRDYVEVTVGGVRRPVPLTDIETIQMGEDVFFRVVLRSGEQLDSSTRPAGIGWHLVGQTTMFGLPAVFRASFDYIQSIAFQ